MSRIAYYEPYHRYKPRCVHSLVENQADIIAIEKEIKLIMEDRGRG